MLGTYPFMGWRFCLIDARLLLGVCDTYIRGRYTGDGEGARHQKGKGEKMRQKESRG